MGIRQRIGLTMFIIFVAFFIVISIQDGLGQMPTFRQNVNMILVIFAAALFIAPEGK